MLISFVSAKHSPGVTCAALSFAAAARELGDVLFAELDPAGGEVAALMVEKKVSFDPGLMSLAASSRRGEPPAEIVMQHAQMLPTGVNAILAPPSAEQAAIALGGVGMRLSSALAKMPAAVFADCGRWDPRQPSSDRVTGSSLVIVVIRPTVTSIEHARSMLNPLAAMTKKISVILVGDKPYGPAEVGEALNVDVLGVLDYDSRSATLLSEGNDFKVVRRTPLTRSAFSMLDKIRERVSSTEDEPLRDINPAYLPTSPREPSRAS